MGQKKMKHFALCFICLLSLVTKTGNSQEMNILTWSTPNEKICLQNETELRDWIIQQLPFPTIELFDFVYAEKPIKIAIVYGYSGLIRAKVFIFLLQDNRWILEVESNTVYLGDKISIVQKENRVLLFSKNKQIGVIFN